MYSKWEWISLILLLGVGGILLFRTPHNASNLEIVPDSVEYAFGALNLSNGQGYHIRVGGRDLPPRYPPWFSFALVPAYWIFGSDPGNGIYVIFGFALVGLIAAFELGKRISGVWGGVGAGVLLLAATDYHYWGRQIMTDVPSTTLVIILLWVWLGVQKHGPHSHWALAGILLAMATAFRPTSAAFVLPFLYSWLRQYPRRWTHLALLMTPCLILFGLSGYFNQLSWGSFSRAGYAYWCAVPYDYRHLLYSFRYLPGNLRAAWDSHGIWLSIAILFLWVFLRKQINKIFPTILLFSLLGGIPILLFHMVYFYPDARFYLPLAAIMAITCGGMAGTIVQGRPVHLLIAGQIGLIIAGLWMTTNVRRDPHLVRRQIADLILQDTPPDAVIVTAIEPAYLENFPGVGERKIIPISRTVEYASKVLVRRRIRELNPEPSGWWDHRGAGLLAGGAEEVISWTAYDNPGQLNSLAASNQPIFFERISLSTAAVNEVMRRASLSGLKRQGSFDLHMPLPSGE